MKNFDSINLGQAVWILLGIAIGVVIVIGLTTYIGAFLFAIFLYFATRPLYHRLNAALDHPNLTVTLTVLAVVLPLLLVVGYAVIVALQELDQFLATHSLDGIRAYLQPYLGLARERQFQRLWDILVTNPGQPPNPAARRLFRRVLGRVPTVAGLVFAVLTQLFLVSIFLFYFLRDDHKVRDWFFESVDYDRRAVEFVAKVSDDLETVFFGNLAIIAVSGSVAVLTYYALNLVVPGGVVVAIPVLLGLLTGIATLVPLVGMKAVYVPYTALLLATTGTTETPLWHPFVFFVVTLVVVDTIPDFFVRSWLAARSGVHMGLVLLGYALGTLAFGWSGLFLGPIIVVLTVHFGHLIFPRLAGDLSSD
ncbi:AI-2E family transporter [Halosimplex amylolyticum]|uniref:AI-2E family transporter n=1 Tax=Halosimplex amylolyticum TaxID=3396616 RepID=UPI003F56DEF1